MGLVEDFAVPGVSMVDVRSAGSEPRVALSNHLAGAVAHVASAVAEPASALRR
jgi:hypothetical protein